MKVRIINGARGVEKTVNWRENKNAALERKAIRNVDFIIFDDRNSQSMAQQRLTFPENATERDIATAVETRARELVAAVVPDPTPIDIAL